MAPLAERETTATQLFNKILVILLNSHPICDDGYHYQFFTMSSPFAARTSVEGVEEEMLLAPKFDLHGLIPVVTTNAATVYEDAPNSTQL